MSTPNEDILLNALNHQIRRDILKLLKEGNKTYSQLLNHFIVPTGNLNYHLRLLEGLIEKDLDNLYQLTALGIHAWNILERFRNEITETERPMLRQAYISQKSTENSFMYTLFVTRMKLKFFIILILGAMVVTISIYYIILGGNSPIIIGLFILGIGSIVAGLSWIRKTMKNNPEFIAKIDRVINHFDKEAK